MLSLSAVTFWLLQVAAGVAIEGLWLLDEIRYHESGTAPQAEILAQRLEAVVAEGAHDASLWATGTVPGQFKIFYEDRAGAARVRRLDCGGRVLYDVPATSLSNAEGLFRALSEFHQALFCGTLGNWIVAMSGALLCTNLILGLRLALRTRIRLWHDLMPRLAGSRAARRYRLHRALGLWIVIPGFAVASTGVALGVCDGWALFGRAAGVQQERTADVRDPATLTSAAQAIELALGRYPGSRLSALTPPASSKDSFEVLLRAPQEMTRFWGTTRVRVSANAATVQKPLLNEQSQARRILEAVYPLHSGQAGGIAGRVAALTLGAALLVAFAFGILLWNARRAAMP